MFGYYLKLREVLRKQFTFRTALARTRTQGLCNTQHVQVLRVRRLVTWCLDYFLILHSFVKEKQNNNKHIKTPPPQFSMPSFWLNLILFLDYKVTLYNISLARKAFSEDHFLTVTRGRKYKHVVSFNYLGNCDFTGKKKCFGHAIRVLFVSTMFFADLYLSLLLLEVRYAVAQLRHCATIRKVAVRFPMESLRYFIDLILPAAQWSWGRLSL